MESAESQIARLKRLAPDRYHIEATATGPARQRLVELLDSLRSGDEFYVASLSPLCLEVGEVAQLVLDLIERGVKIMLIDEHNTKLNIGNSSATRSLLGALSSLHRHLVSEPNPKTAAGARELLSEAEIQDIRRMRDAGLSPRRIGLIYRRSPKCISEILWGGPDVRPDTGANSQVR